MQTPNASKHISLVTIRITVSLVELLKNHRRRPALPIAIETHGDDIGVGAPKRGVLARDWMDPIEQQADVIAPIPIEAKRKVVVLSRVKLIESQPGPATFDFPGSEAQSARSPKKVASWHKPAELGAMLSETLEVSILAREAVSRIRIGPVDCCRAFVVAIDIAEEHFALYAQGTEHGGELDVSCRIELPREAAAIDQEWTFVDLGTGSEPDPIVVIIRVENAGASKEQVASF